MASLRTREVLPDERHDAHVEPQGAGETHT